MVLALAAFGLLGAVLLSHIAERSGKRSTSPTLPLNAGDAQAATTVPLVPESVVVPTASAPAVPIAPLAPSPSESPRKRR